MTRPNINIVVGGPQKSTSIYKTVVLKNNLSFAGQLSGPDTKYIIRWDYSLNEEEVRIPDNCILVFDGGSINAGTIVLNDTKIYPSYNDLAAGSGLTIVGNPASGTYKYDGAITWVFDGSEWKATTDQEAIASINANIAALDESKQDTLVFDNTPTSGSLNPVRSGGIKNALDSLSSDIYHKNESYSKSEVNSLISRTPSTDIIIVDRQEGETPEQALDRVVPSTSDRPNKLFRVKDAANTYYDEYAWDGSIWVPLAEKDYGIDNNKMDALSENTPLSKAIYQEIRSLVPVWDSMIVKGNLDDNHPGQIQNTSSEVSRCLVIPLQGNEKIEMGYPPTTCYYVFASAFSYPSFTRVSWEDIDRNQLQRTQKLTFVLDDGNHAGAKYLIIQIVLSSATPDRRPTVLTVNDIDYNSEVTKDIASLKENKVEQAYFDNMVGNGFWIKTSLTPSENFDPDTATIHRGTFQGTKISAGTTVDFHIWNYVSSTVTNENDKIFLEFTQDYVTGFYDVGDSHYSGTIVAFKQDGSDLGSIKEYSGTYTPEVDCYVHARGLTERKIAGSWIALESWVYLKNSITSHLNLMNEHVLEMVDFNLKVPPNKDGTARDNYDVVMTTDEDNRVDSYYGMTSIAPASNGRYYMYYEATKPGIPNDNIGLSFAYSDDAGETWVKGFPNGREKYFKNCLFPLARDYRREDKVLRQQHIYGPCVVKVNDSRKPYRLFANRAYYYVVRGDTNVLIDSSYRHQEGDSNPKYFYMLYMWKSSNGYDFTDETLVSELAYDSQYSVIPYGDVLKVYCRMWDYTAPLNEKRMIGALWVDLDGNIVSSATALLGHGMYNSAAFKIGNNRELLLPTRFDDVEDKCYYCGYIVIGDEYIELPMIEGLKKDNFTDEEDNPYIWGTFNPGFILDDGDIYLTYTQRNYSHDTIVRPAKRVVEIRRVRLDWIRNGSANKDLQKPKGIVIHQSTCTCGR